MQIDTPSPRQQEQLQGCSRAEKKWMCRRKENACRHMKYTSSNIIYESCSGTMEYGQAMHCNAIWIDPCILHAYLKDVIGATTSTQVLMLTSISIGRIQLFGLISFHLCYTVLHVGRSSNALCGVRIEQRIWLSMDVTWLQFIITTKVCTLYTL